MAGGLTISTLNDSSGVLATQNGMSGIAKAWVNFNGITTTTIRGSFNVSSITRNGSGDYTVNFTTAMPDANYSASALGFAGTGLLASSGGIGMELGSNNTTLYRTASAFRFVTMNSTWNFVDTYSANVSIFR